MGRSRRTRSSGSDWCTSCTYSSSVVRPRNADLVGGAQLEVVDLALADVRHRASVKHEARGAGYGCLARAADPV